MSPAPGAIQVVREGNVGEASGGSAAIELILDTSGSMLQPLEGRHRIDIARDVLGQLVRETIPAGTPVALRVFGDTPESCETNLVAPLQPLDPGAMSGLISGLQAIDGVNTPIGASLEQVAIDLQGATGTRIVVTARRRAVATRPRHCATSLPRESLPGSTSSASLWRMRR